MVLKRLAVGGRGVLERRSRGYEHWLFFRGPRFSSRHLCDCSELPITALAPSSGGCRYYMHLSTFFLKIKTKKRLSMVVHTSYPSTWQAKAGK